MVTALPVARPLQMGSCSCASQEMGSCRRASQVMGTECGQSRIHASFLVLILACKHVIRHIYTARYEPHVQSYMVCPRVEPLPVPCVRALCSDDVQV